MRPVIFVSHSAKDAEVGPVEPNDEAAVERRRRLEYSRLVRSEIVRALRGPEADSTLEVWLDQETLKGGDHWRPRVHRALGSCDGGVILFDTISIGSDWLRKEATILMWRQAMAPKLRIVPVFLGDFTSKLLKDSGWGAIHVDDAQAVRLHPDPMTEASAKEIAQLVAERFAGLVPDDAETPMRNWVADVAGLISETRPPHARRAAGMLGLGDAEWDALADPHVTMAHHLLHSELADAYEPALELLRGLDGAAGRRLVEHIAPIWVTAQAGRHLHASVVANDARLILVNLRYQDSAREYLERAWCGRVDRSEIVGVPRVTGEEAREALADVDSALREGLGYAEDEQTLLEQHLRDARNMFVLVGPNAVRGDVIEALHARYPTVRLLVVPGHDYIAARAELPTAVLIEPPADAQDEAQARVQRRKLTMNITR